jgi:AAA+ superfamily predicted ATPase
MEEKLITQSSRLSVKPRSQSSNTSHPVNQINHEPQDGALDEKTKKELLSIFDNAPQEAREIVNHLKDATYLSDGTYRSAFFIGDPGTGKTTVAKAIAYKMLPEWRCVFRNSTDIIGEYRNQAAKKLNQLFTEIDTKKQPTLLVIDELNQLLEHAESENHDTDATSKALWGNIDRQSDAKNNNFFFIGIMNHDEKLPKPMKSRILLRTIVFSHVTSSAIKVKLLKDKIVDEVTQLDKTVDDWYLQRILHSHSDISGRDFHEIALKLRKISRRENQNVSVKIITKKHFEQAFEEYHKAKRRIQYDISVESDEERRHKENLAKQEEHFKKNQALHQEQFVQAQILALAISTINQPLHSSVEHASLVGTFNPEQQKLIDEIETRIAHKKDEINKDNCNIQ